MIKKLSKYGNSFVILIDKPILDLLNIDEKTLLKIKTDGNQIIIEPIRESASGIISQNEKLQKSYEKLVKKYEPTLKKLAKN